MNESSISETYEDPNEISEGVIAKYIFKPHLQTGLIQYFDTKNNEQGQRIDRLEDPKRPQLDIGIQVNQGNLNTQLIELYTSGDIIAFDKDVVIRTDPTFKTVISNYEPNYMPLIEFSEADFPWRYTPAIADDLDRLTPWITLIVLKEPKNEAQDDGEFTYNPQGHDQPFPSIQVNKINGFFPLPDLDYQHSWAHVQITTDKTHLEPEDIDSIIKHNPKEILSRILCPRKLESQTKYRAFLVPTFEIGRAFGLDKNYSLPSPTFLLQKAWDNNISDSSINLPYYFSWEFYTGKRGDFEYLVRLLEPREIDKRVGSRQVNTAEPGYAIPDLIVENDSPEDGCIETALGLEGALKSLTTKSTNWPTDDVNRKNRKFINDLQELLNLSNHQVSDDFLTSPDCDEKPVIVPPMYGRWQGKRSKINKDTRSIDDNSVPDWFTLLNLDPRCRAIAGFGTLVVQDQQESLVEAAWNKLGQIKKVNQLLRTNQMSIEVSEHIRVRNLLKLPQDTALAFISPLNSRVLFIPDSQDPLMHITPTGYLAVNPALSSMTIPSVNRILRSEGPIRKRQRYNENTSVRGVLSRINEGDPNILPAGQHPEKTGTFGGIFKRLQPSWTNYIPKVLLDGLYRFLLTLFTVVFLIGILVIIILNTIGFSISTSNPILYGIIAIFLIIFLSLLRYLLPSFIKYFYAKNLNEENFTAETLKGLEIDPEFTFTLPEGVSLSSGAPNIENLSPEVFKLFAIALHEQVLDNVHIKKDSPPQLDLRNLHVSMLGSEDGTVMGLLNPRQTILNRTRSRINSPANRLLRVGDLVSETLQPIVAAPEFHQPMYSSLRDISQELVLPGIEFIPQNTLGLLITNQEFIESYMVGLCNAFSEEALFREMPIALNATYFRQFWDVKDSVPPQTLILEIIEEIKLLIGDDQYFLLSPHQKTTEFQKVLREKLKDINFIERWNRNRLGNNRNPVSGRTEESLVLLMRGDLIKKYPDTVVYATKGKWKLLSGVWVRRPTFDYSDDCTKHPIFTGTFPPDINFFGFDLTETEIRGVLPENRLDEEGNEKNPGWFIVLEERIGETRFGADDCDYAPIDYTWNNFCWSHIDGWDNNANYIATGYIDDAEPTNVVDPSNPWSGNAGIRARILLQKPFRVAVHGDDMLPEEGDRISPEDSRIHWGL